VRAPSAHSLRMQGKQRVDGSGRDVGMMRRAAVEAVEQQLGRPDLAEALGGWMQHVEQWVADGLMRDGQFCSMIEAVEKRLCRIEGGLQQHLKQHGRRGEQQMGRVVEAVMQMRDEMKGMRVGQGEMGRLVKGMGKGVLDVGTGLSGLGSTVRAIQRELAGRVRADRHLADMVSGLQRAGAVMGQAEEADESKQQLSPLGSGGKQQGAGRGWVGRGELERKQLQFDEGHEGGGAGQRETEQEQQHDDFMKELDAVLAAYEKEDEQAAAMRAEKEQEHEQEATRRAEEVAAAAAEVAALAAAREERERQTGQRKERARVKRMRGEEPLRLRGLALVEEVVDGRVREVIRVQHWCPCDKCKDEVWWMTMVRSDECRKPEGLVVSGDCGTQVCFKAWDDGEIDEETGRETELWEGRVMPEEKREVQPFGCASTSC
jgi:hypothetical protein